MKDTRALLGAIFLATMGLLAYELALTRLFSVTMWYHMAFMAISLALFGLAAAGCLVFLAGRRFPPERMAAQMSAMAAGQAAAMALAVPILLAIPFRNQVSWSGALALAAIYLAAAVPFFFGGLVISLALTHRPEMVGRLYFADLTGAALGCLLVVPGLAVLGAPVLLVSLAALPALAALWLARAHGRSRQAVWATMALVLVGLLLAAGQATPLLRLRYVKGVDQGRIVFDRWNAFSRVTVSEPGDGPVHEAYTCGLSPSYRGPLVPQKFITIDGVAGTPLTAFDGALEPLVFLDHEVTSLAYKLRSGGDVLIIGPGGGEDVLAALRVGRPRSVAAVEINPLMGVIARQAFREFAGPVYDLPQVTLTIAEGREFVSRSRERYDVLQASMVDTWAATSAGAYTLTENNLYTVEAFREFYDHLTEGGIFTMSRFIFEPPRQTLRLAILCRTVMEELGIEEPARQVILVREPHQRVSTLLWKRGPFTEAEIETVIAAIRADGFEPIYLPGRGGHPVFRQALEAPEIDSLIAGYPFDIRPSTDDRPFFFNAVRLSRLGEAFTVPAAERFNYTAVFVLVVLLGVVALATAATIVVPLALTRRRLATPAAAMLRAAGYFGLIGVAFMVVEVVLIQHFILLLGHPIYSLTVIVFSLLAGGGIGSRASLLVRPGGELRALRISLAVVAGLLAVARWGLPRFLPAALPLGIELRITLTAAMLVPLGVAMGFPFPLGIRLTAGRQRALIPWAYGVNGAASVLASVLAVALAMAWGYSAALGLGLGLYLAAMIAPAAGQGKVTSAVSP